MPPTRFPPIRTTKLNETARGARLWDRLLSRCDRARRTVVVALCGVMFVSTSGCQLVPGANEAVVRVQARQNQGRAARLTRSGIAALNKGQIDHAAEKFTEAVAADMTYGPAHNNLGLMHFEQGNLYQAALAFDEAIELLPYDATARYNLALTLESAGRLEEALELYYEAHEMDPSNPNYLGNLVRLRVRRGEYDELLTEQLRDLILIETRPEWRRWADEKLALDFNSALDRGPETPDFNSDSEDKRRGDRERDVSSKIIDLTPDTLQPVLDSPVGSAVIPSDDEKPEMITPSTNNGEAIISGETILNDGLVPNEDGGESLELGPDTTIVPNELAPPQTRLQRPATLNEVRIQPVSHGEAVGNDDDYYRTW